MEPRCCQNCCAPAVTICFLSSVCKLRPSAGGALVTFPLQRGGPAQAFACCTSQDAVMQWQLAPAVSLQHSSLLQELQCCNGPCPRSLSRAPPTSLCVLQQPQFCPCSLSAAPIPAAGAILWQWQCNLWRPSHKLLPASGATSVVFASTVYLLHPYQLLSAVEATRLSISSRTPPSRSASMHTRPRSSSGYRAS